MHLFDYCVITASNERQAGAFRRLIERRVEHRLYPREISFRVYSDPPAGRIGSGGGTVWALGKLVEEERGGTDPERRAAFFSDHRILLLHAGGESRRMPCYAPEGKLFAPVPAASSSILPPVVLDLQLNLYLDYPWHDGEVVVGSGDVIIGFDASKVPDRRGDVCGFAAAAPLEQGSHHGVFVFDASGRAVAGYYQKKPAEYLLEHAAFEGTDECALDIGIISMSPRYVDSLLSWSRTPVGGADGSTPEELFGLGEASFDLYRELMLASLEGSTETGYLDEVGSFSRGPKGFLASLFRTLHRYPLHAVLVTDDFFLHVGSLSEYITTCAEIVRRDARPFYHRHRRGEITYPSSGALTVVIDSPDASIESTGEGGALVDLSPEAKLTLEGGNIVTGAGGIELSLPESICLESRGIDGGRVWCVYSTNDTFKADSDAAKARFCNIDIDSWLADRGLSTADLASERFDVFDAKLFSPCFDIEFMSGFLRLPDDVDQWRSRFLSASRFSLRELNDRTDPVDRDEARSRARAAIIRSRAEAGLAFHSMSSIDAAAVFSGPDGIEAAGALASATRDPFLKQYRLAVARELIRLSGGDDGGLEFEGMSFVPRTTSAKPPAVAVKKDQIVWARSPVRFDLAGGWTDTPPYTNRFGGAVVNLAVDLNGQPPIQVFVRPTTELHVRMHSIDLGVTETCTTAGEILAFDDPTSAFSLPRAALRLLGLVRDGSHASLEAELERIGCGLEVSLLCAVPKGSGLGTSSVLGATIIAALNRFFGIERSLEALFLEVLELEQMLTTGGGWQDQIGGVVGGVKYVSAEPAAAPAPVIHQLDDHLFTDERFHERFTLFYTGITRLAKNILGEVVDEVNRATPAYLFTHRHLTELAVAAKTAIEQRRYETLAAIVSRSWEANKLIHRSTTNDEVERLLAAAKPSISGAKLLGAGGGGYALFASPTVEAAGALRSTLSHEFEGDRARIVEFSLSRTGLVTTVS